MIGDAVKLSEAVEDAHYDVGKALSRLVVREGVSEVDQGALCKWFSRVLSGDEDHRPAVARVAQHAYDALHHALRNPTPEGRLQPRPREPSSLELAEEHVALVRLYAPRRVDVDDRRRRKRRPGSPAAIDVPQPPGTRVDQTPYPQASLPVRSYPDEGTLRVGGYRESPELPRIEGKRAGQREPLEALGRPPLGGEKRGLGEDGTEDYLALLLAQHARLVADLEETLQRRSFG